MNTTTNTKDEEKKENTNNNLVHTDSLGNIIIYDPEYNRMKNPVYYQSPNIIVPNPHLNDATTHYSTVPIGSSSPMYSS